jgi:hypothetical protein
LLEPAVWGFSDRAVVPEEFSGDQLQRQIPESKTNRPQRVIHPMTRGFQFLVDHHQQSQIAAWSSGSRFNGFQAVD